MADHGRVGYDIIGNQVSKNGVPPRFISFLIARFSFLLHG